MWWQMKQAIVESTRQVCGSVKAGGKYPKRVWWNDEVKPTVKRKEAAWKEVLVFNGEEAKERSMEAYREEKRRV